MEHTNYIVGFRVEIYKKNINLDLANFDKPLPSGYNEFKKRELLVRKILTIAHYVKYKDGVSEWPMETVLKTVSRLYRDVGSNPTPSVLL